MEIEFLGTGTSTGVPQIGCRCNVCRSADPKDNRLRCSAIVRAKGQSVLIDCGPDFRQQILRAADDHLDAVLLTHIHYDHVGGMEDLRAYCASAPFPVYGKEGVLSGIKSRIAYCFVSHPYPGVPSFDLHAIEDYKPFKIGEVEVEPLPVLHYKLWIQGFKIGNLAYITDAKQVPEQTIREIEGIDTLVINALRMEPHLSHMSLSECLEVVERVHPRRAFLTHMSHGIGLQSETEKLLPENVYMAFDGLRVSIEE